eukprot:6193704-Pleurochrysis_carterae.AAC.1
MESEGQRKRWRAKGRGRDGEAVDGRKGQRERVAGKAVGRERAKQRFGEGASKDAMISQREKRRENESEIQGESGRARTKERAHKRARKGGA